MKTRIQELQQERDKICDKMLNTKGSNVYHTHLKDYNKLSDEIIKLKLSDENTNNRY